MVESIKKLREICQKPVISSNTWYQRKFIRRISIYLTWLFIQFRISGNVASIIMLITGIIATSFFTLGNYSNYIMGALLLQFWYVLDHIDGELARYWKKTSAKGIFIDKLNHHIVHPFIFLALGIGMYRQFNNPLMLVLGAFSAYFLLLQDLINIDRKDSIIASKIFKTKKELDEKLSFKGLIFKKTSAIIYKIPGMMNIITIGAIFNLTYYIFLFYSVTFPIMVLLKLIYNLSISSDKFK